MFEAEAAGLERHRQCSCPLLLSALNWKRFVGGSVQVVVFVSMCSFGVVSRGILKSCPGWERGRWRDWYVQAQV